MTITSITVTANCDITKEIIVDVLSNGKIGMPERVTLQNGETTVKYIGGARTLAVKEVTKGA